MTDSISVAVERLRASSERLNALCDTAAQSVRELEAYLQSLNLGFSASISAWTECSEDDFEQVELAYQSSSNGTYRVAVIRSSPETEYEQGSYSSKPWAECSRDDKLRSFEKLPELLSELTKKLEEKLAKAEHVVTMVAGSLPVPKKKKGA